MNEPLSYHAMRMRWCRAALWAFLRRWAAYLAAAAFVSTAGMAGGGAAALQTVQAGCAWLVLPLFRSVTDSAWVVPATGLQALFGALLVAGMRPLLWPARWAASERALPLARRETLRSDALVVAIGLAPLALVCAVGAEALVGAHPPWLLPLRAVVALILALTGSVLAGVALLQCLRRSGPTRSAAALGFRSRGKRFGVRAATAAPAAARPDPLAPRPGESIRAHRPSAVASVRRPRAGGTGRLARAGAFRALLWWPLWRVPAQRSGRTLLAGSAALCLPALGLWRLPGATPWWLAVVAVGALVVVTRVNGLMRDELHPLLRACSALPLALAPMRRRREALALLPLPLPALLMWIGLPRTGLRSGALIGCAAACLGSCAFEVFAAPPVDASGKSSRWLFCVVLMLAFASEVAA